MVKYSMPPQYLHIRSANGNQRPAELANKKERIMTKYTQILKNSAATLL
jgi:hypothetical protein